MLNKFSHIIVVVVVILLHPAVPRPCLPPTVDLAVYPSLHTPHTPHCVVAAAFVAVVVSINALLPASMSLPLPLPLALAVAIASHRFASHLASAWIGWCWCRFVSLVR